MKCFNCGASVLGEHKNCPYCGQSMQIVPDYNFLEDDDIHVLMEESIPDEIEKPENKEDAEEEERIREQKRWEREREKKRIQEQKKKRLMIIILISVVAICAILFAAFFKVNEWMEKKNASSFSYQIQQAESALKEDDFETAKEYYYKALNLKPENLDVRFTLAELYAKYEQKEDMIAMYEDILSIDPKNYTAYKMLFQYYNSLGDVDAILELRKNVTDDRILSLFQDYAVENPKIYLKGGNYSGAIDVMITSNMSYKIYYTLDGSDPTENGILYTETIKIKQNGMVTLKAVSKNDKGVYSNVVQETYYLSFKAPDDPIIKPEGVYTFDAETYLEIIVPSGCTAYYAWDLDEKEADILAEDANRLAYVDGIRIPSGSHKLTLVIVDNTSGLASSIYRRLYTCTLEGIPLPEQFIKDTVEDDVTDDVTDGATDDVTGDNTTDNQ